MTITPTKTHRLDELHRRLSGQVLGLISGADWQAMVAVASRFHRYRTGTTGTRRYSKGPDRAAPRQLHLGLLNQSIERAPSTRECRKGGHWNSEREAHGVGVVIAGEGEHPNE